VARAAADRLINTYRREYPAAVGWFEDDLDALLNTHRVPVRRRIRVRTTNLAERSFVEQRRRTKVIGRLSDERLAIKLVFATMIRAAERWCRVSISDLERHQLELLRAELGLDPPPATNSRKTDRRKERSRVVNQAADLQNAQNLTGAARPHWSRNPQRRHIRGTDRDQGDVADLRKAATVAAA
jgi:hypothetical protein